jgi:hypothetical protein
MRSPTTRSSAGTLTGTVGGYVEAGRADPAGAFPLHIVLTVTGGTGAYRNVRGQMDLKYRNPAGTEFDFVFHLIG